ncbi:MAG: PAS domain-containing protein [Anaerolineales bacterium]|nr:PAS domain-containing protein [Anaerolineales bacterium]
MDEKLILVNRILETAVSTMDPKHVLEVGCRTLAEALGISQLTVSWSGKEPVCYSYPLQTTTDPRNFNIDSKNNRRMLTIPGNSDTNGMLHLEGGDRELSEQEQTLAIAIIGALERSLSVAQRYEKLEAYANSLEATAAQRTFDLRNERDRTHSILEALGEVVVIADMDGMIQYINAAAVSLTGYSRQDVWGKYWGLWFSDSNAIDFCQKLEETVRKGQVWDGQVVLRRKDGRNQEVGMTVMPYFDMNNSERPVGFIAVQRDITPEKEIERLKDYFISNVSHELKTPLSVIMLLSGNLDMLYNRMDDDKRREIVKNIRENTRVLGSLISDLLYLSRIDNGRVPKEYEMVDLAALVRIVVNELTNLAEEKGTKLQIFGVTKLVVQGNEEQLGKIVHNLLHNAIYNSPKNNTISCEIAVLPGETESLVWPGSDQLNDGTWAAFQVADSNSKLLKNDYSHIFNRFYRTVPSEQCNSNGLGLTIASELVRLHEGKIAVYSNPSLGNIISFYLPLKEKRGGNF